MKKQYLIKNPHIIANIQGFLSQNYQGVFESRQNGLDNAERYYFDT